MPMPSEEAGRTKRIGHDVPRSRLRVLCEVRVEVGEAEEVGSLMNQSDVPVRVDVLSQSDGQADLTARSRRAVSRPRVEAGRDRYGGSFRRHDKHELIVAELDVPRIEQVGRVGDVSLLMRKTRVFG